MDRVRRRTGKLLSTLLLEERGTRNVLTLLSKLQVGDTCVRCGEGVENLEHIVHHCPHWSKERCESGLPSHAQEAPACVRLHGLLPAPPRGAFPGHEPPLVMRAGVHTVWTDGSGRHSSNPLQEMWGWRRH
eukprot:5494601-Amphidinium_carterae.2